MQADINPVSFACSQLQNYDPERALTDYINRLEALQRRLGSVQSGEGRGALGFITNIRACRHFQP